MWIANQPRPRWGLHSSSDENQVGGLNARLPPDVGARIIPLGSGGQDNIDNLQLLRTHCNRVKRDWPRST